MQEKVLVLKYLLEKEIRDMCAGFDDIALQVSGGLDSAILFYLCKEIFGPNRVKAYCVSWEDEDWEYSRDARLAIGEDCTLKVVTFSYDDMVKTLPIIAEINPTACWSQVGQWFCNRQVSLDGIEVVMTGEAADELFGGYSRYKILWWLDQMRNDPKLADYAPMINYLIGDKQAIIAKMVNRKEKLHHIDFANHFCNRNNSLTSALMHYERNQCLDLILADDTQMATCHDLVNVMPFACPQVRDFAATLTEEYLFNKTYAKLILRVLAQSIGVPNEIINETTKKGFFIPQKWRPAGEKLWSTAWFDGLMKKAIGCIPQHTAPLR